MPENCAGSVADDMYARDRTIHALDLVEAMPGDFQKRNKTAKAVLGGDGACMQKVLTNLRGRIHVDTAVSLNDTQRHITITHTRTPRNQPPVKGLFP